MTRMWLTSLFIYRLFLVCTAIEMLLFKNDGFLMARSWKVLLQLFEKCRSEALSQ